MVRVRQQALVRERDHLLDTAETAMQLQEHIAKDIFLLAAASTHRIELVHRWRHEPHRGGVIPLDDRHLSLEQRCAQRRPVAARTSLGQATKSVELLLRFVPVIDTREGDTDPVVHPGRQEVRLLEQPFTLLGQVLPDRVVRGRVSQHFEAPQELDSLVER